jgi:Zn-finger nucleic acid-binding protein
MNCPKCGNTMREREREIGGGRTAEIVVIDVCPACGGIWLDKGELEKLTAIERSYDARPRRGRDDDGGDDDDDDGGFGGGDGQGGRRGLFGRIFDGIGNLGD